MNQAPVGSISRLMRSFPDLYIEMVDGTNVSASYASVARTAAHCRSGTGPALLHARVLQPRPQSGSDQDSCYCTPEEWVANGERDPLPTLEFLFLEERIITVDQLARIRKKVTRDVEEAAAAALEACPKK